MLVTCPHCTNQLTVSREIAASGAVQCPHCNNILSLALPAARPTRAARATATPATDAGEAEKKSLNSCLGCFVLIVAVSVVVGVVQHQNRTRALEDIAAGDKLYAEGKKAEAVARYKAGYEYLPADRKPEIVKLAADFEATSGSKAEARYWVEKGLSGKLEIAYGTPAARDVLDTVRRERAEAQAKKEAEAAKRKAEAEENEKGIKVTVDQIQRDYQTDKNAADEKYKGKMFRVSGTVFRYFGNDQFTPDFDVQLFLLDPEGDPVICFYFRPREDARLRALRPGQQVTIRGRCEGNSSTGWLRVGKPPSGLVNFKECSLDP